MSAHREKRPRARGGFTLIEVVVSMGLLVIGSMAIIGLQNQTIAANSLTRQRAIALQIAQTWIERFKQDASLNWTQAAEPSSGLTPAQVIGNTLWLSAVNAAPNVFQAIPNLPLAGSPVSNAFDFRGNEVAPAVAGVLGNATTWFCVSYRPAWVYPGRALRVDVRVFWPRPARGSVAVTCVDDNAALNPGGTLFDQFSTVYLSTVIVHTEVVR